MKNFDIEKEKKMHPYNEYGKVFEVINNQDSFLVKSSLKYVVDSFDEYLNSIEQSHYEELDYNIVENYNIDDENEVLDLTWMNKKDVFDFKKNNKHKDIRQINVNIDNIEYSYLPIGEEMFHDIKLVLKNNNSNLSIVKQLSALKSFIKNNGNCLSEEMELIGFPNLIANLLSLLASNYGIEVQTVQKENNKVKIKKIS